MSLIFRLSQSNLPASLITTICDFFVDSILVNKVDEYDKILKSTFLEIVRHAVQSFKEASDRKLLENDEEISIKQICERYGSVLADQVVIRLDVQKRHNINDYLVIPSRNEQGNLADFQIQEFEEVNQKNDKNGKFGWCIVCRKAANYYCRNERVPVCSFQCKQLNLFQTRKSYIIQNNLRSSTLRKINCYQSLLLMLRSYLEYFPEISRTQISDEELLLLKYLSICPRSLRK